MGESMSELMKTVQDAVEETLSPIQYHIYFNLQKSFYECGLNCFNNKKASQNDIQNCLERCQAPLQRAQMIVDNELNRFQERLERSFLTCRDKVEAYGGAIEGDDAKVQQMEKCMGVSLKEHMKTLPHLANSIQSKLTSNK
ncbi:unnamed protein product [Calypogeia fissa]